MQGINTENKLAQHSENKLAQPLCDFCELQLATIRCYRCLMYLCSADCHSFLMNGKYQSHPYVTDFAAKPVYVNMSTGEQKRYTFEEWCLIKGARHSPPSLMSAKKFKQLSKFILESLPKFIPELANIVNEYIASQAAVGLRLDCLDCDQDWYVGQIVQIKGEIALIKFDGWTDVWNEWICFNSKRFAQLR